MKVSIPPRNESALKQSRLNKGLEKIHNFRILLETTIRQIADRAELRDREQAGKG